MADESKQDGAGLEDGADHEPTTDVDAAREAARAETGAETEAATVERTVAKKAPAKKMPAKKVPAKASVEKPPAKKAAAETVPAKKAVAKKVAAKKAPPKAAAEAAPTKSAPARGADRAADDTGAPRRPRWAIVVTGVAAVLVVALAVVSVLLWRDNEALKDERDSGHAAVEAATEFATQMMTVAADDPTSVTARRDFLLGHSTGTLHDSLAADNTDWRQQNGVRATAKPWLHGLQKLDGDTAVVALLVMLQAQSDLRQDGYYPMPLELTLRRVDGKWLASAARNWPDEIAPPRDVTAPDPANPTQPGATSPAVPVPTTPVAPQPGG